MMYPRRQDAAVLPDDCSFHPVIGWPAVQFGIATSRACSVAIPLLIRAGTGATGWNMPPEMHRGATFRSLMCRRVHCLPVLLLAGGDPQGDLDISSSSPACMAKGG